MPIIAAATCIFIGWVLKPSAIDDEVMADGNRFKAKTLYRFMVKYFAPVLVILILVQQVCSVLGYTGWSI